jgi:hypothetical protein
MTSEPIGELAGDWGAMRLWRQVEWAADDWWASQRGDGEQIRAWVCLLLAVGNFKAAGTNPRSSRTAGGGCAADESAVGHRPLRSPPLERR